tara:strand:+ start:1217 stop:1780 length:564 start_codon:yes stop_codon:yes gene_type:complete
MNWRHRVQEILTGERLDFIVISRFKDVKKIVDKCRLKHPNRRMKHFLINPFTTIKKYQVNGATYRVKTQLTMTGCRHSKGIGLYGRNAFKTYEKLHIFHSYDAVPDHLENAIDWRWSKDKGTIRGYGLENIPDPNAKWIVWELIKTVTYQEQWHRGKIKRTSIVNTDIQNANKASNTTVQQRANRKH